MDGLRLSAGALQVVAHIATREWPHRWPDLFASLTLISQRGDAHSELALMVLRGLADGLFDEEAPPRLAFPNTAQTPLRRWPSCQRA